MSFIVIFDTLSFSIAATCLKTRSSAIAEGPRDTSCQLKSCQLPRNSAETTYTTSPDQTDGMKLKTSDSLKLMWCLVLLIGKPAVEYYADKSQDSLELHVSDVVGFSVAAFFSNLLLSQ